MSDVVRNLRVDVARGRVRASIETASWIVPVEVDLERDPEAAAAVEVLLRRMHATAVDEHYAVVVAGRQRLAALRARNMARRLARLDR